MFSPETVAFEIHSPRVYRRTTLPDGSVMNHRRTLVTVWHHDPCSDGSDDSCGFTVPKLSKAQLERLKSFAWDEGRHPYFMRCPDRAWSGSRHEAEALYRGLVLQVARCLRIEISYDHVARYAAEMIHNPGPIDAADTLCFLPGYHSNFAEDRERDREDRFLRVAAHVGRWLLHDLRPWYRHPRWHVRHWKVVVHPWNDLKRWLFARCVHCRKRFGWNEESIGVGRDGRVHMGCDLEYERAQAADRLIREVYADV